MFVNFIYLDCGILFFDKEKENRRILQKKRYYFVEIGKNIKKS